jgi:hypothetical protein
VTVKDASLHWYRVGNTSVAICWSFALTDALQKVANMISIDRLKWTAYTTDRNFIKAARIVSHHWTAYKVCHSFQLTLPANKNEELIGVDANVNATDNNGKSSATAASLMAAVEKLIVVHVWSISIGRKLYSLFRWFFVRRQVLNVTWRSVSINILRHWLVYLWCSLSVTDTLHWAAAVNNV